MQCVSALGEVLGIENGTRCVDYRRREVHVVQQLRFHKAEYGGFYLAPPKSGSVGDVDLDDQVATVLAEHVRRYPPTTVELPGITRETPDPAKKPKRRPVARLFTDEQWRPFHDQRWSIMWAQWRRAADSPEEGTFHSLRHYFATSDRGRRRPDRRSACATPTQALWITLETYVHWWPKGERPRGVVGAALQESDCQAITESTRSDLSCTRCVPVDLVPEFSLVNSISRSECIRLILQFLGDTASCRVDERLPLAMAQEVAEFVEEREPSLQV